MEEMVVHMEEGEEEELMVKAQYIIPEEMEVEVVHMEEEEEAVVDYMMEVCGRIITVCQIAL